MYNDPAKIFWVCMVTRWHPGELRMVAAVEQAESVSWHMPQHRMFVQQAERLRTLNATVNHFKYVYSSSLYSGAKYFNSWMLQKTTNMGFTGTHFWKEYLPLYLNLGTVGRHIWMITASFINRTKYYKHYWVRYGKVELQAYAAPKKWEIWALPWIMQAAVIYK